LFEYWCIKLNNFGKLKKILNDIENFVNCDEKPIIKFIFYKMK